MLTSSCATSAKLADLSPCFSRDNNKQSTRVAPAQPRLLCSATQLPLPARDVEPNPCIDTIQSTITSKTTTSSLVSLLQWFTERGLWFVLCQACLLHAGGILSAAINWNGQTYIKRTNFSAVISLYFTNSLCLQFVLYLLLYSF